MPGTSLTCLYFLAFPPHRYVWEKDGATMAVETNPRVRLDRNGSLHISQTWSGDIGTYTCRVLSAGGNDSRSAHLRVR
jgi:protein sidekick